MRPAATRVGSSTPPAGTCTATNLEAGATYISDDNGVKNYTGQLEDVFTCIAAVGDSGCGFEQPLASVVRALGADGRPAPPENQGFLRPDALLFIVLLTDEDDCSVPAGSNLFDTTQARRSRRRSVRRRASGATSSATSATASSRPAGRRPAASPTSSPSTAANPPKARAC